MVDGLEAQLVEILTRDPHAVIDDRLLSDHLHIATDRDQDDLALLLADLVVHEVLVTTVLWNCANGFGTSTEAASIPELPESLECDRCGEQHRFSAEFLDLLFLPAPSLLTEIRARNRDRIP
jgi:hypothetical protein